MKYLQQVFNIKKYIKISTNVIVKIFDNTHGYGTQIYHYIKIILKSSLKKERRKKRRKKGERRRR